MDSSRRPSIFRSASEASAAVTATFPGSSSLPLPLLSRSSAGRAAPSSLHRHGDTTENTAASKQLNPTSDRPPDQEGGDCHDGRDEEEEDEEEEEEDPAGGGCWSPSARTYKHSTAQHSTRSAQASHTGAARHPPHPPP